MARHPFYPAVSPALRNALSRLIGALVLSSWLWGCNPDRQAGDVRHLQAERDAVTHQLTAATNEVAALRAEGDKQRAEIRQLQTNVADFKQNSAASQDHSAQLEKAMLDNEQKLETRDMQMRALEARVRSLHEEMAVNKEQNAQLGLLMTQYQTALADQQRQNNMVEEQLKTTRASADAGGATEQVLAENAALKQRNTQLEQLLEKAGDSASRTNPVLIEQAKEQSRQAYKRFRLTEEQRRRSPAARKNREKVKLALQQAQNELARLVGARGVHVVAPGETLMSIAGHHYRDGRRWPEILEANRHLLDRPEQTRPGLVLVIP